MSSVVSALVSRAFRTAPVSNANAAIDAVRLEQEALGFQPFSYELFVPRANADEFFLSSVLPKLVAFLHDKGYRSGRAPGLFVSLFTPEGLHFIEAGAVLEVLGGFKQLGVDELFRRYGAGGSGEPKRLGP